MHEIVFYHDKNGKSQILDFLNDLTNSKGKDARINAELNGISNAEFICGDAAFAVKELGE